MCAAPGGWPLAGEGSALGGAGGAVVPASSVRPPTAPVSVLGATGGVLPMPALSGDPGPRRPARSLPTAGRVLPRQLGKRQLLNPSCALGALAAGKGDARGRCRQRWAEAAGTAAPAVPLAAAPRWSWTRPSQPPASPGLWAGLPSSLARSPSCRPFPGLWGLPGGGVRLCACERGGPVLGPCPSGCPHRVSLPLIQRPLANQTPTCLRLRFSRQLSMPFCFLF